MPDLENRFTYHAPKPGQPQTYQGLRSAALGLAKLIEASCPDSPERNLALVRLDETVFWANASIARHG